MDPSPASGLWTATFGDLGKLSMTPEEEYRLDRMLEMQSAQAAATYWDTAGKRVYDRIRAWEAAHPEYAMKRRLLGHEAPVEQLLLILNHDESAYARYENENTRDAFVDEFLQSLL